MKFKIIIDKKNGAAFLGRMFKIRDAINKLEGKKPGGTVRLTKEEYELISSAFDGDDVDASPFGGLSVPIEEAKKMNPEHFRK